MVEIFSEWLVPVLLIIIPFYGLVKKAKVYEIFIEGAKEGLDVVVRIFPSLLAMLVAIGVLRASGALNLLAQILMPFTQKIGMPEELVPLALIRPLSGSGALGIATELMKTY
ncbi:nucleoside recognition domain-containing protein, partial [Caldanaerobacter subterraneus]